MLFEKTVLKVVILRIFVSFQWLLWEIVFVDGNIYLKCINDGFWVGLDIWPEI